MVLGHTDLYNVLGLVGQKEALCMFKGGTLYPGSFEVQSKLNAYWHGTTPKHILSDVKEQVKIAHDLKDYTSKTFYVYMLHFLYKFLS